jgi:hypothetical protein
MLFRDGSPPEWLTGQVPLDLIVTPRDATSAIDSIFIVEEGGIVLSFRGLAEVLLKRSALMIAADQMMSKGEIASTRDHEFA